MGTHRGGGRFGRVQNSWPFVKLSVEPDGVSLTTILQDVRIKREFIQEVIIEKYFLNQRVIFIHNDPTIKKEIEFWTFSPGPVRDDLTSQGYPVSNG